MGMINVNLICKKLKIRANIHQEYIYREATEALNRNE